jgi:Ca-activated chloride channel family protein
MSTNIRHSTYGPAARAAGLAAALLAASACSPGAERPAARVPAAATDSAAAAAIAVAPADAPPRPAPGADLAALPPPDAPGAPGAATAAPRKVAPVDLGADRPVVKIAIPTPALGHTASFAFEDGKRGWVARLPTGYGVPTPAYGDGRIYVSGGFETYSFYALDAETGKRAWTHDALEDNGPTAPIYAAGNVVFNTESCTLFVLDARSGRTKWSKYLGDPTLSQPAVADGIVFASYPAGDGQMLGAFKINTGVLAWSRAVSGELISAPMVAGDSVYATTIAGTTYRFRRADGKLLWSRNHGASSAPWFFDGELFLSRVSKTDELQIALSALTGKADRILRTAAAPYAGDVPRSLGDWRKVWAFEGSRPVIAGGRRFDTMSGEIHASDPKSGEPLWIRRYADGVGKRKLTAPAVAGAKIFFATYDGDLYALDTDTGMTVWAYSLGVKTAFQPIVARGWVYLATETGSVIGLPLGDSTLDGWHMWGGNPGHNGLVSDPI